MKLKHRIAALLLASIYLCSSFSVYATEGTTTAATETTTAAETATTAFENATEAAEDTGISAIQTASDAGGFIASEESSGLELVGEATILVDAETGSVLYSRNAQEKHYPASITKIMTTLVALENGNLSDPVTFTAETLYAIEQGSSRVGVEAGETITLEDALYCVMLASGNDTAAGVGEHIAGSVEGFVDMMNQKVEELGCTNTHFENPHGLHGESHYTCAADMAIIMRAAVQNPDFCRIASAVNYTVPASNTNEERPIWQHHKMILPASEYHYDGVAEGKTGFTSMALNTLVTTAERDGVKLIAVILRCQGAASAYSDTKKLFDYGFETYTRLKPLESFSLKTAAAASGVSEKELNKLAKLEVLFNADYSILAPKSVAVTDIAVSVTTENATDGIWGSIVFKYKENEIGRANIYYDADAELNSIIEDENTLQATAAAKAPFLLVAFMAVLVVLIIGLLISMIIRR